MFGKKDMRPALIANGCSPDEIDYLIDEFFAKNRDGHVWLGRRAELNGLIGTRLIEYIEAKLDLHGVGKVTPAPGRSR